jgi:hypothetical protein
MNRVKEIEKELAKLRGNFDKIARKWDGEHPYLKNHIDDSWSIRWKERCKFLKPFNDAINKLDRELRLIKPYTLSKIGTDSGDLMSLDHFIACVKAGGFIDYDGFGNYVKYGKISDIEIYPSDVKYNSIRKDFKKIIWYNR